MNKKFKKLKSKSCFTLLEIVIVLIIIAVLAASGAIYHLRAIEGGRGKYAEFNLISIYNAQKRYRLNNLQYYGCVATCSDEEVSENLEVDLADNYFIYTITEDGNSFIATATRKDEGDCAEETMTINQDVSEPVKSCSVW